MSGSTGPDEAPLALAAISDARGHLIAIEAQRQVPFAIERVYYMYGTPAGTARGAHAHRRLRQLAICISGSCVMELDDGRSPPRAVVLDRPDRAVPIPPMVWHVMRDFTPDAILLVLADAPYDEADYIRDRDEFLRLAQESEPR